MAGLGGIWTEALNDVRIFSPDLSRESIVKELRQLEGASVLDGARGQQPLDVGAVARTALILAGMMKANPDLQEIEITPLVVHAEDQGALALDALLVYPD